MRKLHHTSMAVFFLAVVVVCRGAAAQEEFEGWHLEPGVSKAHLVMVARVSSISSVTVVEGAKTDLALREYRFQPVRMLKGIFGREELSMTAADLGCPADNAALAPPLKEGEFRLLILAQQRGRSDGCVSAAPGTKTFGERVPLLTGPDDPLVAVVETLIRVVDSRSRRDRAALLIERLADTGGVAAVPLLSSLRLRADWAATDQIELDSLARLAGDPLPAVRGGALEVLRDVLAAQIAPQNGGRFDGVADALRKVVGSDEAVTSRRLAALEALGHLLALEPEMAGARELLIEQLTAAATHAERATAAAALARIAHPQAVTAVLAALRRLPLDEPPSRERVYAQAAVRLDAAGAERVLLARLQRSIVARQSLEAEIEPLGRMRSTASLPLLLEAAPQPDLAPEDRHQIARALGRLGDDRAVPVLVGWLRSTHFQLRYAALGALASLDSQTAAREVRPLLRSEPTLWFKLRLARLLARHGIADGYALATEHLADAGQTAEAALVLAALDDPRTEPELSAIVAARPDRRWRAAALTGLAAIGDSAARDELLVVLADDRDPLAAQAAEAVGVTADSDLLLPLGRLVQSRNKQIAKASLLALRRFLSGVRNAPLGLAAAKLTDVQMDDDEWPTPAAAVGAETRAALAESVASLALDAYVEPKLRQEALAVARLLRDAGYAKLLSELADRAELEGTPLLAEVQAERRRVQRRAEQL